jgi:pimeloyl-ACP methyl ester carboxylesterase
MNVGPNEDDHLTVRAAAPDWFHWALDRPQESRFVEVEGCPVHYLLWRGESPAADSRGLLLVHGGGAHARWWAFIAPFFTRYFRVAAIDLSGMGDSGQRSGYDAEMRAKEMRAVIGHGDLGALPFVVGHSFGGFMTMKFGAVHGDEIGGAVIVDSPIRSPEEEAKHPRSRFRMGSGRVYDEFEDALARFKLMPEQSCDNDFLVEYIGRHSLKSSGEGWTWKFHPGAMGARRFGEPFHEYLQAVRCRAALIFGQQSALVSRDTAAYMSSLMGPGAPIVEIPQAQHHVMLDQPLAFVAALRTLLDTWSRAG